MERQSPRAGGLRAKERRRGCELGMDLEHALKIAIGRTNDAGLCLLGCRRRMPFPWGAKKGEGVVAS